MAEKKEKKVEKKDDIVLNDPQIIKPEELPLVVELPKDASAAQVAYAKVVNAYAYQNPTKFATKKAEMLQKLKDLKNAPDPVESNLKINGSDV